MPQVITDKILIDKCQNKSMSEFNYLRGPSASRNLVDKKGTKRCSSIIEELFPEWVQPVLIPPTTPRQYLSFLQALNLRLPDELTGDWHFMMCFYCPADRPPVKIQLAGEGAAVDTIPSLGSRGIRNMADELVNQQILDNNSTPVWVANHARAIADLAMGVVGCSRQPYIVTVNEINQWLDTREQVDELVHVYLEPLRQQKEGADLALYDEWLQTIHYH